MIGNNNYFIFWKSLKYTPLEIASQQEKNQVTGWLVKCILNSIYYSKTPIYRAPIYRKPRFTAPKNVPPILRNFSTTPVIEHVLLC